MTWRNKITTATTRRAEAQRKPPNATLPWSDKEGNKRKTVLNIQRRSSYQSLANMNGFSFACLNSRTFLPFLESEDALEKVFLPCSCLLLRYASQNSLDESSQKHVPRPSGKEKPPYHNHHHTHKAFDVMNEMRKWVLMNQRGCENKTPSVCVFCFFKGKSFSVTSRW